MVFHDRQIYDSNHGDAFFQIVTVVTLKLAVAADRPPINQWDSKSRSSPSAALKNHRRGAREKKLLQACKQQLPQASVVTNMPNW